MAISINFFHGTGDETFITVWAYILFTLSFRLLLPASAADKVEDNRPIWTSVLLSWAGLTDDTPIDTHQPLSLSLSLSRSLSLSLSLSLAHTYPHKRTHRRLVRRSLICSLARRLVRSAPDAWARQKEEVCLVSIAIPTQGRQLEQTRSELGAWEACHTHSCKRSSACSAHTHTHKHAHIHTHKHTHTHTRWDLLSGCCSTHSYTHGDSNADYRTCSWQLSSCCIMHQHPQTYATHTFTSRRADRFSFAVKVRRQTI